MSDSGIVRDISEYEKPLCPNMSTDPGNKAHELYVRVQDAIYDTAEKDSDGEIVNQSVADIINAVSYLKMSDRMDLYFIRTPLPMKFSMLKQEVVESYYYKCHICGFILPAQRC
jgi:hypothetical protein